MLFIGEDKYNSVAFLMFSSYDVAPVSIQLNVKKCSGFIVDQQNDLCGSLSLAQQHTRLLSLTESEYQTELAPLPLMQRELKWADQTFRVQTLFAHCDVEQEFAIHSVFA